ncbi:two component system response regulator [Chlamydia trachomatis]|nr:two component system response regulator [Chlamydia trachomatis]
MISLHIPPLRDRKEDILPLAHYYLEKFCKMNNKPPKTLSLEAQRNLLDYSWPGNVRELSNVLERTVILENDPAITPSMLALL